MQGGEDREEGENILRGTLWEPRAQSIPSHPPVALHRKSHLTHKARHQQCVTTHLPVPSHTMFYQFPVGLSPATLFLVCANAFTIHTPFTKPGAAIPTGTCLSLHMEIYPSFEVQKAFLSLSNMMSNCSLSLITTIMFSLYLSYLCTCLILHH